jgi:hypothetical protein
MLLPHIFFISLIILHMYAFYSTNPPYHDKQWKKTFIQITNSSIFDIKLTHIR